MSFILDALRRAEAERARGAVPGLHTPESALPSEAGGQSGRASSPWLWVGVATALLLTAGLAWWLGGRGADNSPAPASVAVAPVPVLVPAEPPPGAMPAPGGGPGGVPGGGPGGAPGLPPGAVPGAVPGAAPRTAAAVAPVTAPVVAPALPAAAGPTVAPALPRVVANLPPPRTGVPASARRLAEGPDARVAQLPGAVADQAPAQLPVPVARQAPADPTAPAAVRLPTLAELPEALRAQVPALVVAGGMYADVPSQRLAILNGQVVHEGDQPAPGLKVEQIRRRSVVFNLNGQRFEMPM